MGPGGEAATGAPPRPRSGDVRRRSGGVGAGLGGPAGARKGLAAVGDPLPGRLDRFRPAVGVGLGEGVRGFKESVTSRADSHWDDDDSRRAEASAALGRPTGEETPVDGEVMRDRS